MSGGKTTSRASINIAASPGSGFYPGKAAIDGTGRLYVMQSNRVSIFSDVAGSSTLVTELTGIANPNDVAIVQ